MFLEIALTVGLMAQPAAEPCYDLLVLGRLRKAANVVPLFEVAPPKPGEIVLGATADVLIRVDKVLEGRRPPRQFWARDIFTSQWAPDTPVIFYLATDENGAYGVIDDRRAERGARGRLVLPPDAPKRCPRA